LTGRRGTARYGQQVRLGSAIELAGVLPFGRSGSPGGFQTFFHQARAHARHGGGMHFQGFADGFVTPGRNGRIGIGLPQNAGLQESAGSGLAAANH
jgi:hypothetical protein